MAYIPITGEVLSTSGAGVTLKTFDGAEHWLPKVEIRSWHDGSVQVGQRATLEVNTRYLKPK